MVAETLLSSTSRSLTHRLVAVGTVLAFLTTTTSGCYSWVRIPVTRSALEEADLQWEEVRVATDKGQFVMVLEGIYFPGDPEEGLSGAYLEGVVEGQRLTVELRNVYNLEVSRFDVWGTVRGTVGSTVAAAGGLYVATVVVVGFVGLVVLIVLWN